MLAESLSQGDSYTQIVEKLVELAREHTNTEKETRLPEVYSLLKVTDEHRITEKLAEEFDQGGDIEAAVTYAIQKGRTESEALILTFKMVADSTFRQESRKKQKKFLASLSVLGFVIGGFSLFGSTLGYLVHESVNLFALVFGSLALLGGIFFFIRFLTYRK